MPAETGAYRHKAIDQAFVGLVEHAVTERDRRYMYARSPSDAGIFGCGSGTSPEVGDRKLLNQHLLTRWPEAVIRLYDPQESGRLPEDFSGAGNDLEVATRIARHMITRYGMSDRVGPVSLESDSSQFLQNSFVQPAKNYSEQTQKAVDDEVRALVSHCEDTAMEVLEAHRGKLDEIRSILMDKEVIEREEFEQLMSEGTPDPEKAAVVS